VGGRVLLDEAIREAVIFRKRIVGIAASSHARTRVALVVLWYLASRTKCETP